jgi:hypothetical protein
MLDEQCRNEMSHRIKKEGAERAACRAPAHDEQVSGVRRARSQPVVFRRVARNSFSDVTMLNGVIS